MKKVFITLGILISAIIVLQSCKKEKAVNNNLNDSLMTTFLNKNYETPYLLGKQTYTYDENNMVLFVQEILTDKNNKGYLIMNKEKTSIYYFVNFDFSTKMITIKNLLTEEVITFDKPDYFPKTSINKFDLLKDLNNNSTRKVARFWGWACGPEFSTGLSDCYRTCCYYIFWRKNGCSQYGCNDLPGSNPKLID